MSTTAPLAKRSLVSSSTASNSFRNGLVVALAVVSACAGLKAGRTLSNTFSLDLSNGQTYGPSPAVVLTGVR